MRCLGARPATRGAELAARAFDLGIRRQRGVEADVRRSRVRGTAPRENVRDLVDDGGAGQRRAIVRRRAQARAQQLGIAHSTAREYLDRIRAKYVEVGRPAPTKVDLLRRAVEDGILPGLDAEAGDGRG